MRGPQKLWRTRMIGFGSAGIAAAIVLLAPSFLAPALRSVAAYDAGAAVLLAFHWFYVLRDNATHTAQRAVQDDPGRNFVLGIVLLSIAFGLFSAIQILGRGIGAGDRDVAVALGLGAVILGWCLIHTTFIFRYAHLFYFADEGNAARGLEFPGTKEPDDYDFAYFSFVIGMTFQVSDVEITDPAVRRIALLHALISFAYNTAILALGVNLVSSILNAK